MSDSSGSKTNQSGINSSLAKTGTAALPAARSSRSASAPAPKRNFAVMAFLIVGVLSLLSVLVFIVYDRLRTPSVVLPASMPVASEVQEWNKNSQVNAPAGGSLTAVDPVSREPVDPNATPYKINIGSSWFYFTSEANLKAFTDDPFKYVKVNINVKLLKDGAPASADEGGSSGQAASGGGAASASDNASLYQQIPAPQTAGNAPEAAGAAENAAAVSESASGGPAGASVGSQAAPADSGGADASLYQQVPPPSAPNGGQGADPGADASFQGMNNQAPPQPPPGYAPGQAPGQPPAQNGGYPGIGEAIQQNTPVGMPLQDYGQ